MTRIYYTDTGQRIIFYILVIGWQSKTEIYEASYKKKPGWDSGARVAAAAQTHTSRRNLGSAGKSPSWIGLPHLLECCHTPVNYYRC